MSEELQYERVFLQEAYGDFPVGVRIEISVGRELTEQDRRIARSRGLSIFEDLCAESIQMNPAALSQAAEQRAALLACFPSSIYVDTIPNGYCSQFCCRHLPWFVVTTRRGRIQIGWRKRVINIDWSDSDIRTTAEDLFPNEDTTKDGRLIHAWGYEKARWYIQALMEAE